jgi:hypothetical protein
MQVPHLAPADMSTHWPLRSQARHSPQLANSLPDVSAHWPVPGLQVPHGPQSFAG